jgi:hypothetical protein
MYFYRWYSSFALLRHMVAASHLADVGDATAGARLSDLCSYLLRIDCVRKSKQQKYSVF